LGKGATWYVKHNHCPFGGGPPPICSEWTVTKDTIINGKYCTRLLSTTWPCPGGDQYIHDDNGKVFRFDTDDQEFRLVIDYTKKEGESWKVKVCPDYLGCDTVTVTVIAVNGIERLVSTNYCGFEIETQLIEGVGGLFKAAKLLIFLPVFSDCGSIVLCYEDPTEGFIYGDGGPSCFNAAEDPGSPPPVPLSAYPNPSAAETTLAWRLLPGVPGEVRVYDAPGRLAGKYAVAQEGTMSVPALPAG
jgi:hypothetical protein